MTGPLGIGILGAHTWAEKAHLPGYVANPRARVVAICDVVPERARAMAERFGIARATHDPNDLFTDPNVVAVDVCTPTDTHVALSRAAIEHGKHVLCEKPLARTAAEAFALAAAAQERGVRTKLGFTFRYSPAMRQLRAWIADGTLGEIFHVHALEQNSQFLDPTFPLRQIPANADTTRLIPSSVVGYGSHLVDLMRWCVGEFQEVVSTMRNFIPMRHVRGYEGMVRMPAEDGTVALVEFASGAHGMLQTSYVAVGNYPGIDMRVYGSKGAAIARLVTENGVAETLHFATPDQVEFRAVHLAASHFPPGTTVKTPWAELYYRNLIRLWVDEILDDRPEECTFHDGAKSQEIVDALVASHERRGWVRVGGG